MDRRRFIGHAVGIGLGGAAMPGILSARADAASQTLPTTIPGATLTWIGVQTSLLKPAVTYQRQDQWCWAACIETIFHRYGYIITQESVVATVFGGLVDRPGTILQILQLMNHSWVDQNGRRIKASSSMKGVDINSITQELANDHPLIIGTHGHAMLLTEVAFLDYPGGQRVMDSAVVRDPWPASGGRRILFPKEWNAMVFTAKINIQPF